MLLAAEVEADVVTVVDFLRLEEAAHTWVPALASSMHAVAMECRHSGTSKDSGLGVETFQCEPRSRGSFGSLALAVGCPVLYNTNPSPRFETTDTSSTLNLVYEIR